MTIASHDAPGPASMTFRGFDLHRPECVLATSNGDLFCSDWRGGVTQLRPDGSQHSFLGKLPDGSGVCPNGIALLEDGSFLLAHLGADRGGVYRLQRNGEISPWLVAVEGLALPPTNFVYCDNAGWTWVTVSTRRAPRSLGYRRDCNDGFIVSVSPSGQASIAAEGLGYTNEVALHPSGRWLYVNETFGRRLSRFQLNANGALGKKEVVAEFGPGTFPDGLAFDEEGCAWVVSIVSNRLIRISPDGTQQMWLGDADSADLRWVEDAYNSDSMDRRHLDRDIGPLHNISSIAFAGNDRRTGVLGCLLGERLATLPMPAAGVPPAHWNFA